MLFVFRKGNIKSVIKTSTFQVLFSCWEEKKRNSFRGQVREWCNYKVLFRKRRCIICDRFFCPNCFPPALLLTEDVKLSMVVEDLVKDAKVAGLCRHVSANCRQLSFLDSAHVWSHGYTRIVSNSPCLKQSSVLLWVNILCVLVLTSFLIAAWGNLYKNSKWFLTVWKDKLDAVCVMRDSIYVYSCDQKWNCEVLQIELQQYNIY